MHPSVEPVPNQLVERPTRSRSWAAWVIVAALAVGIGASFLFRSAAGETTARSESPKAKLVTAAPVTWGTITQRGQYPGELDADTADVAAFYAGRLLSLRVRVGDTVAEGEVLAELDPVDAKEQIAAARAQAKAAQAERIRATIERDAADRELARLEPLAQEKLLSPMDLDRQRAKSLGLDASVQSAAASEGEASAQVRLLQKRVVESQVRAPFAGRIAERYVDPGVIVAAGARLVRIVALAPLRVHFEVSEQDIPRLRVGTVLAVNTKAGDRTRASARITGIASEISRERRVARVEGLIENPPAGWLPGMYAEVIADLRTLEQATIVPSAAVVSRLEPKGSLATGVFIVSTGNRALWVPVREVAREGDRVAVAGELSPKAEVLVLGHLDLADGGPIQLAGEKPTNTEKR